MNQVTLPLLVAAVVGAFAGGLASYAVKPTPTIVRPQTTVVARPTANAGPMSADTAGKMLTRAERRAAALQWGDMDQKEVDALTALLNKLPKVEVVIFCAEDAQCGDLRDDLENSFESAHWKVNTEKPLIDATVGVATSSPDIRKAINEATSGRLNVGAIQKNAPYEAIALGRKPRDNEPRKTLTIEQK